MIRRPVLSIIVFGEDNKSIEILAKSLENLDKDIQARIELSYVVFNRTLSEENRKFVLSMRKYMAVQFKDYLADRHDKTDLAFYSRGKNAIVKKYNDIVTNEEVLEYIKKEAKK